MAPKAHRGRLALPVHRANKGNKAILVHKGQPAPPAPKALLVLLVGILMAIANLTKPKI